MTQQVSDPTKAVTSDAERSPAPAADFEDPIREIMCELKLAVEAEVGARDQPPQAGIRSHEKDGTFDCIRGIIEVITMLARQCADTNKWVHERFAALDVSVNSLVDEGATVQKRLLPLTKLEAELKMVTAQNERTAATTTDLCAQLLHLQKSLANWQAENSSKTLQNKLEALAARVLSLESRAEGFTEIKSDARRANAALSTMADDVETLFAQLAMVSKQVSVTSARLETFRRHLDQFPD